MKKFVLIILALFIFTSCQETITESPTSGSVSVLSKKPVKPPNEEIVPFIEQFSLGGVEIINDNIVRESDFDIDITDAEAFPQIKFRVTNSIPFLNIRIRIFYDANCDSYESWNMEFNGYISNSETIGIEGLFDEELQLYVADVEMPWDGSIEPLYNDPVYGSDYIEDDYYVIKDQLASIYSTVFDGKRPKDRFGIQFEVYSGERGEYSTRLTSFMWLKANSPINTFHVEDIEFIEFIPAGRGNIQPTFRIKVLPDETTMPTNGVRRKVWVRYSGILYGVGSSDSKIEVTDDWSIINGPAIKVTKKTSGYLTLTVKSVNQFGWTYNPSENVIGSWNNGVEPSITISIPDGSVVP